MKVLVVTPVMRGELYAVSLRSMYRMDWDGQLDFAQLIGGDYDTELPYNNITRKYNEARAVMLANGYDALMTVESDMVVPRDALKRLAAVDADVAYGLYVWKHGWPYWNCYLRVRKDKGEPISMFPDRVAESWGKVINVEGVGNGCTLIHRRVLEELEFNWSEGEFGCCDWHLSVDCQEAGFTQKMDLAVVCGHISTDPVPRILYPHPTAKGYYTHELLPSLLPDKDWKTGHDAKAPIRDKGGLHMGGPIKMTVLRRFHWKAGVYRNPDEVISVSESKADLLERRGLAERIKVKSKSRSKKTVAVEEKPEEKPGWTRKEPCDGCDEDKEDG